MTHEQTDIDILNSIDSAFNNPISVIYQSGYLTIKSYDVRLGMYKLGFPNREVEEGFIKVGVNFSNKTRNIEKWGGGVIYI